MKDFLGNELKVGDEVVFSLQLHRRLSKGVIASFTKSGNYVNVKYNGKYAGWSSKDLEREYEIRQLPEQVMKVTK